MLAILFTTICILAFWYDAMDFSAGGKRALHRKTFILWQICASCTTIYGVLTFIHILWIYAP